MIDVLFDLPFYLLNALAFWLALFHFILDMGIIIYVVRKTARAQSLLKHFMSAVNDSSEPTQQEMKELLKMDDFEHV